jgi:DNA mismatch endonuclease (patch repair protein)
MRANTRRDTSPELEMRRLLRRHKLSFKCDARGVGIRYRADFIFSRPRIAVFVDGCFWHGCPIHWSKSKTRTAYWLEKRRVNRLRDRRATKAYVDAGWIVYRIWEHDRVQFPFLVSDLAGRSHGSCRNRSKLR